MCSPGCPLQHLLGVTPLPLDLSPENPCRTWDLRAKFPILIVYNAKSEGPLFEPPTLAQLAGSARVLRRVSPPTPTRCYPVAFGLKPRESVPHLGPQGQISYFNRIERKVRGSTVRAPDLGPTSGKCKCAPRVSPPTPTRCNPVAFRLKPRESVPHLGPKGQISYFNRIERKV